MQNVDPPTFAPWIVCGVAGVANRQIATSDMNELDKSETLARLFTDVGVVLATAAMYDTSANFLPGKKETPVKDAEQELTSTLNETATPTSDESESTD